jgi:hypothetical protein
MWAGLARVGDKAPRVGSGGELVPIGRLFTPLFGEFRKIDQTRLDFTMIFNVTMFSTSQKRPQKRGLGRLGPQFGHSIRLEQFYS